VAASARARAAVRLARAPARPCRRGRSCFLPAAALAPPAALATLRAAGPGACSRPSTRDRAPVLVADAALAAALASGPRGGSAARDDLDRALKSGEARLVAEGWYVLARDARGVAEAEARLYAALGSPSTRGSTSSCTAGSSFHVTRAAGAARCDPERDQRRELSRRPRGRVVLLARERGQRRGRLGVYVTAVVLEPTPTARSRGLTLTESRLGEWLDVIADSLVHTLVVLAMGVSAQSAAGAGLWLGVLAAVGILASAAVAKWWPDTGAAGAGGALVDMGSPRRLLRDAAALHRRARARAGGAALADGGGGNSARTRTGSRASPGSCCAGASRARRPVKTVLQPEVGERVLQVREEPLHRAHRRVRHVLQREASRVPRAPPAV